MPVTRTGVPYTMGTNLSGWGYPLFQALTFSSPLPGSNVVDVDSASGSAPGIFGGIRGDLSVFSLVLPFIDDDDTGVDSSEIGLRRYIGGLSDITERVEMRL